MASSMLAPTCVLATCGRPRPKALRSERFGVQHKHATPSVVTLAAPTSWALTSYDELVEERYKCEIINQCAVGMSANSPVANMMVRNVITTTPDASLAEIEPNFAHFSGMPVVSPKDNTLVGVVSKKDMKPSWEKVSQVKDVMSSPPISIQAHTSIQEAACLMLKYKVHRLPVVDDHKHCIGIVTRSDIFAALGMFH